MSGGRTGEAAEVAVISSNSVAVGQHPPIRPRRLSGRVPERLRFGVSGFVGVLILWEISVRLGFLKSSLISSPTGVIAAALTDFGNGTIQPHIGTSFLEWLVGFAAALVIAIPLGFALGSFPRLEFLFDPLLAPLYAP